MFLFLITPVLVVKLYLRTKCLKIQKRQLIRNEVVALNFIILGISLCIFFLQGKYNVPARIKEIGRKNCYISEITVGELLYGAACSSKKEEHLAQVNEFVNLFVVLPIYPILPFFAESKAELRKQGQLIDDFDILIGVTAVANKMTLVSENLKHLSRIPNIKTENWIMRK